MLTAKKIHSCEDYFDLFQAIKTNQTHVLKRQTKVINKYQTYNDYSKFENKKIKSKRDTGPHIYIYTLYVYVDKHM